MPADLIWLAVWLAVVIFACRPLKGYAPKHWRNPGLSMTVRGGRISYRKSDNAR